MCLWLCIYIYIFAYIFLYIFVFVLGIVGNGILISLSVHTNWKIDNKVYFDFLHRPEWPYIQLLHACCFYTCIFVYSKCKNKNIPCFLKRLLWLMLCYLGKVSWFWIILCTCPRDTFERSFRCSAFKGSFIYFFGHRELPYALACFEVTYLYNATYPGSSLL